MLALCACTSGVMDERCDDAEGCATASVGDGSSSTGDDAGTDQGGDTMPAADASSSSSGDEGPAPACIEDADCEPPPPQCQDETRSVLAGAGRCEDGACTFAPTIETCLAGCDATLGACRHDVWLPLPELDAPQGRREHTLVWSDGRAIVWGGLDAGGDPVGDGAWYDPATDAWTALPLDGGPEPRAQHSAVTLGSRMIVFGGYDGGGTLASGGSFDFDLQAWSPIADAPAFDGARHGHAAVIVDDRMLLVGGRVEASVAGSIPNEYLIAIDAWVLPTVVGAYPYADHATVATDVGLVAWGGEDNNGNPSKLGVMLDRDGWSAVTVQGAPTPRRRHAAVYTGDAMIVWGGIGDGLLATGGGRLDLARGSWSPTAALGAPPLRADHSAVWTGDAMLVFGGEAADHVLDDGARYDPIADSWEPIASVEPAQARAGHRAVWADGQMIVWGGVGPDGEALGGLRYVP